MNFANFVTNLSNFLWGWPMIILLLGTHLYLTIRLKFPQFYILKAIKLSVSKDKDSSGDVSQFGALATSLAATIGTGNIIGVATAISLGGPGAVLWCWITGVLGIATKYSEGLLAIKYRVKTSDGTMLGGPMYALERGLKMKWLAVLFCIFTAVAALGIGNTVQSNAISTLLAVPGLLGAGYAGVPTYISGLVIASLVALVIIFGVKGIAKVCGALVPFMAIFYVVGCIFILFVNGAYLWEALKLIVNSAFSPQAAGAGFIGSTIMMAARFGIARGLFSNESGLGSAPIVAAAAQTRNPVRQALVSSTATFWDTVIICALTGLVLVSSIIAHPDINYSDGAKLTHNAFSKIPYVGTIILTVSLVTFAFSTILGWSYYAEKAIEYLAGKKTIYIYRAIWIILVFVGAVVDLSVVWGIADSTNALMAIPNLIALLLLSGVVVAETRKYLWNKNMNAYSDDEIPTIKN
ncbi:MAG: alanine/glycine:cation symporter family protein [Bacteroidales bacterium]